MERAQPHDEPGRRGVGLDAHAVGYRALQEDAVDGEQKVVHTVDGQLEPCCHAPQHEPADAAEAVRRGKLDDRPVGVQSCPRGHRALAARRALSRSS